MTDLDFETVKQIIVKCEVIIFKGIGSA